MNKELERTYIPFSKWKEKSKQREYTTETPLLCADGTLNAKGWARRNVFEYDRNKVKKGLISRKEWDFYTITDGRKQLLISFANINIGGYVGCRLIDIVTGEVHVDTVTYFAGGNRFVPPSKGDVPARFNGKISSTKFDFNTMEDERTLYFKKDIKGKVLECNVSMDIMPGLENITTVLPFDEDKTRYFMTTKQNCMPCDARLSFGDYSYEFTKDSSFCVMDWGRVNTIHKMVWYWGSGASYIEDENKQKHVFGFEITWAIGNESEATETCIFYDGKVHKMGAVDVEKFPKDRFMEEWKFVSEDGRFNMTMKPTFDNHSDVDFKVGRMNCHQIYGIWNGDVTLDDGTRLQIKDLVAFCEYVENRW